MAALNRSQWIDRAACQGMDVDLFFPDGMRGHAKRLQTEEAAAVCSRCPVRAECLYEAITTGETWGIRGGLSAEERREKVTA